MLLVANYDPKLIGAIVDNVNAIRDLSRHQYDVLNLYQLLPAGKIQIPPYVNLGNYQGVFIHCTVSYNPQTLAHLDERCKGWLADLSGPKIVMKQDEHFRTNAFLDWLEETGVDLVLTCLVPGQVERVYPAERFSRTKFLPVLTGYVTDQMRRLRCSQLQHRPIDIGYRGSRQPFSFGRLSYEKRQIADEFQEICRCHNLVADISSRWEDRLFGRNWLAFLGRCKATLGTESGASVFDFTGEVERQCDQLLQHNPDASFESVAESILTPHEGNIYYNQVSPRHFEAAACRTVQILYEGQYSGIFEPWKHYLPLKRDKTNLDEVLQHFGDQQERDRLTSAAFEEIILDDRFHYRSFVKELDDAIEAAL